MHSRENSLHLLASSAPTTDSSPYELRRAKELNAQLGPKGSSKAVDMLCDIHNTTANMGMCLLFYSRDYLTMHIFKYVQVRALWSHPGKYDQNFLTLIVMMSQS